MKTEPRHTMASVWADPAKQARNKPFAWAAEVLDILRATELGEAGRVMLESKRARHTEIAFGDGLAGGR